MEWRCVITIHSASKKPLNQLNIEDNIFLTSNNSFTQVVNWFHLLSLHLSYNNTMLTFTPSLILDILEVNPYLKHLTSQLSLTIVLVVFPCKRKTNTSSLSRQGKNVKLENYYLIYRAYSTNLGQRSIMARKGTFYEKRALFLKRRAPKNSHNPPVQFLFEFFCIKIKLSIIFEKKGSIR